ncbi:MAG: hypothetical protein QXI33_00710 [Candidatus Pacearchaeota archaeon]
MAEKKPAKTQKKNIPERAQIENIEEIVIDLGNQGKHPAEIGRILKEKYGVHNVRILGKKISRILREKNIGYKKDIDFVNDKIKKIEKHVEKNNQDKKAKRELVRHISHKKALEKYYNKFQ